MTWDAKYQPVASYRTRASLEAQEEGLSPENQHLPRPQWLQPRAGNSWLWALAPWFVAAPLGKTKRRLPKSSSTSYMNGIRGIACLIVYNYHTNWFHNKYVLNPYGAEPVEENSHFTQLPIIRIIYGGRAMVSLFFVLSGFVLAYSPLQKITTRSPSSSNDLVTGISSSILRRFIRLFGPALIPMFLTGIATWNFPDFNPGNWRGGDPTFRFHMWQRYKMVEPLFNPFTWEVYTPQGIDQCWTLALEYRGSMLVFLLCITTAQLTSRARKTVISITALWGLFYGRADVFCFLSGMFLADQRHSPLASEIPWLSNKLSIPRPIRSALAVVLMVCSLVLMSWPDHGHQGIEPYKTMDYYTPAMWRVDEPQSWFWGGVGSLGLMTSIENLPSVQRFLSTQFMLWLGETSFSLYLLHWVAFQWFGSVIKTYFVETVGWSKETSFYIMYFAVLAFLSVAADLYWRAVDEKCVMLGKYLVDWLGVHKDNHALPIRVAQQDEIMADEETKLE